jgi:hypothetical protein
VCQSFRRRLYFEHNRFSWHEVYMYRGGEVQNKEKENGKKKEKEK